MDDPMDEIVQEFLAESIEGLDQFDRDIVALESNPDSKEHLGSTFRIFHTIKGTCGFLGFSSMEELTHGAESLLAKLRDGDLRLNAARTDVLLDVGDTLRSMLAVVEQTGSDGARDVSDLVRRLEMLQIDTSPRKSVPEVQGQPDREPAMASVGAGQSAVADSPASISLQESAVEGTDDASSASLGPDPNSAQPTDEGTSKASQPLPSSTNDDSDGNGNEGRSRRADTGDGASSLHVAERSVRVDVDLLDSLMRQVGELVLARNEVVSYTDPLADSLMHQTVQRLSLIVSELQEGVMKTRMQPLTHLWSKLPRMVRDLCSQFGKEVVVEMDGGETELDRSVLEAVRDPFTHLVRNAVDHGMEGPDERVASGKPRAGLLSVRAYHEGGHVIMVVSDDGRGIDPVKVGDKAVAMGLVTSERLASMTQREIIDLIFSPGFSTAAAITNISGRGVGMDVVRSNIESIGGSVDVSSWIGRGTAFRIKIPLTLAIVPALLVESNGHRFAIPQPNLIEMLHIGTQASPASVEHIDQATVIRLRGKLLPLVRLDEVLGMTAAEVSSNERGIVAVLQADDLKFGLVFDKVFETQEIVVKPLDSLVKSVEPFAGATILGDGTVALIIDVVGLAATAGLRETTSQLIASSLEAAEGEEAEREKTAFVMLRVGENRTVAIPVDQVARLESIASATVEKSGEIDVVQYRGSLMRLVRLHEVLGILGHATTPDAPLKVLVHESEHGPIGFVVAELVDVLEDVVDLLDVDSGYGLAGAVVLHGRVTDVLDLETAILWMQREGFFADAR